MKRKEIFENLNKWKFIILIILIFGGAFYWFQLRPIIIKRNCSWFTQMEAGKPMVPELTKEEAERINTKNALIVKKTRMENNCTENDTDFFCSSSFSIVYPHPVIPAEPDKEVTRNTTKNEYDLCLRHSGL